MTKSSIKEIAQRILEESSPRIPGPSSVNDSMINNHLAKNPFFEHIIPETPFGSSKVKRVMFHGTPHTGNMKFNFPPNGLWFAEDMEYSLQEYTNEGKGKVWACYLNIGKLYIPTEDEQDDWYGEDTTEFFDQLRQKGYDAYWQGMASGSLALLKKVPIINAISGERMD